MMLLEKWSPEVVVGFARKHELFDSAIIPGTITLYQWIDRGIMKTKNMDLLEKLSRKPKSSRRGNRPNKRVLGKSIEERPKAVGTRKTFGHWEVDTVVGNKIKSDTVLLTLVERQTRFKVILKLAGKDAESVNQAVRQLRERAGAYFGQQFKTVTSDNGSEFAGLHDALQDVANVYFSHPYASWERGTSENKILRIQLWMNDYPRKILGYATPHDTFVQAFRQERLAA